VLRAGLHTTVQDGGRWGWQHVGVAPGGALDVAALRRANVLVGNGADEAGLEVTISGCVLRADAPLHVAVTGAPVTLSLAGHPVPIDTAVEWPAGAVLAVGARLAGARSYLAIRGGIDSPLVLGSRSAWPGAPRRGALGDGASLPIASRIAGPVRQGTWPGPDRRAVLRLLPTSEASEHAARALDVLCRAPYRIAASATRMAYPLEGTAIDLVEPARASSGTVTGALQILPSGRPVLLMADRHTTGGYPVVAIVISADHRHAAQLAPGDEVRLVTCTRHEAMQALLRDELAWQRWCTS